MPYFPPPFEGQERFKGRITHSHSYKHPGGYEEKVVVVVGVGNSSMDVTVELSRVAEQVYLSTRRGAYIINRVDDYGRPYDLALTRFNAVVESLAPEYFSSQKHRKIQKRFDHGLYGLQPGFKMHQAHGTISDELPNRIICGAVKVKANIKAFGETSVTFEDGSVVEHVDEVIFATGYRFDLPLLEEGRLVPVVDNEVDLYKYIFPLETTDHNTLGLLGEVQVAGSVIPITELQARIFYEQLSGNIRLPGRNEMLRDVRQKREAIAKRFVHSVRHTIQTDYMAYADELADIIGCKPNPSATLALSDPKLVYHILFGPYVPSLFRLQGPHPWKGAREAVLGVEERVKKPFDTRKPSTPPADGCLCHMDNFAWKALV
ncbi:Protein FMO-1, partial [Aphelenchoides avenae]